MVEETKKYGRQILDCFPPDKDKKIVVTDGGFNFRLSTGNCASDFGLLLAMAFLLRTSMEPRK